METEFGYKPPKFPRDLTLILVRHGSTTGNQNGRFTGRTDEGLSWEGILQARSAGELILQRWPSVDVCYSSPLKRAQETAAIILERLQRPSNPSVALFLHSDLIERDYGIFENVPADEVRRRYPEQFAAYKADKPGYEIPGGESIEPLEARIAHFLTSELFAVPPPRVLIVTHLNPIRVILRFCGFADESIYYEHFHNASVSVVCFRGGVPELVEKNLDPSGELSQ